MRSSWTPSIVPSHAGDQNVYLVIDDYGLSGRAYRETDVDATDLETIIADLIAGQYNDPARVVAFNTAEHWADDVSANVAREIRRRFDVAYNDVPASVVAFVERHVGHERQLTLRLI